MRDNTTWLAGVLLAAFSLSACGGGGGSPAGAPGGSFAPSPRVPASIVVTFASTPNAVAGLAETFALSIIVKDQYGNAMVGTYPQAVTLSDSDTTGATKLSTLSVSSSTESASLSYSGARISGPVTISAAVPGVASANVTAAILNVDGSDSYVAGDTFKYQRTTNFSIAQPNSPRSYGQEVDAVTVAVQPSPAAFNGASGLTDVVTSFTNTDAGIADQTHDYYSYARGNPATLQHYGWSDETAINYGVSQNVSSVLTYGTPSVVDELPHAAGTTWNPAQASTENDTDTSVDGLGTAYLETVKSTLSADGSYQRADEAGLNDGSGAVLQYDQSAVNSDASFTYAHVAASRTGFPLTEHISGGAPTSAGIAYSMQCGSNTIDLPAQPLLPVAVSSFATPAPGVTPFPSCTDPQTGARQSTVSFSTVKPNWYPSNDVPLDQERYTVLATGVPIPSDCQVPSSLASTADHLQYTQQLVDPAREKVAWTSDSYFAANIGLVCSIEKMNVFVYAVGSLGSLTRQISETVVYTLVQPPASSPPTRLRRNENAAIAGAMVSANIRAHERFELLRTLRLPTERASMFRPWLASV